MKEKYGFIVEGDCDRGGRGAVTGGRGVVTGGRGGRATVEGGRSTVAGGCATLLAGGRSTLAVVRLLFLAAVFSVFNFPSSADEIVLGDELIANGSFEDGNTGWTLSTAATYLYSNTIIAHSEMVKVDGVGDKVLMVDAKSATQSGYASYTVTAEAGLYRLRFVYAARSVNGGSYAGATTKVTFGDTFVTSFTTTDEHVKNQVWCEAFFHVPTAGIYALKFQSFYPGDRSNLIDLISLKRVQAGLAIVEGTPGAYADSVAGPTYGKVYVNEGDVLSAPASVDLSRTETADCLGYKLYASGVEDPELVDSRSYTVTSADAASFCHLVWQWNVRERKYTIDPDLFSRKCTVAITGYTGGDTLTNFPVLVKLSAGCPAGFAYGDMATGGADLRFADENGIMAPYEIDVWNPEGETLVWVRVPELKSGGATLTMYYGATDVDSLPAAVGSDVWGDYTGVWHMNVSAEGTVAESTVNAMDGTVQNPTDCVPGFPGMIGGSFTNSSTAYVLVEASDARKAMQAPFTFSSWVYNQAGASNGSIWNDKNDGRSCGAEAGVEIGLEGNYQKLMTRGKTSLCYDPVPTFYRTWRHLVVIFDNDQSYVYMDGVCVTNGAVTLPFFTTEGKLVMGQRTSNAGACAWKGVLDEMRIRDRVRPSDDWIAAEYASQTNGSDFVTLGEVEKTKRDVLAIGNAGLAVNGTTATMSGQLVLDESGETAYTRVVYGEGDALTLATTSEEHTAAGTVTATMTGLSWATRYSAQWEAWNESSPATKVTAAVCGFTTDGTTQIAGDLGGAVSGVVAYVSARVTELRGEGNVTVRLYRAEGDGDEALVETKTVTGVGTISFSAQTLEWGKDYTCRAEFEHVREGVGAWTNSTAKLALGIQETPVKARFSMFGYCSDIVLSGYRGKEALRDFPVLVRLSAGHPAGFDYAKCGANGENIRFADANGGLIPHEIDVWNPDGESLVWVRVPVLMGRDTVIRLYFDPRPNRTLPSVNPSDVWTNYLGVWHMDVDDEWGVKESAAYSLNGTVRSGEPGSATPEDPSSYSTPDVPGIVGGSFTNTSWAYVLVPANACFATLSSTISFSAWVRGVGGQGNAAIWNNAQGGTVAQAEYGIEIGFNPNANAPGMAMDIRGSSSFTTLPLATTIVGDWHLLTVVYRGKTVTVYEDDLEGVSPEGAEVINAVKFRSTDNLALGQRIGSSACRFIGNLDEMRINTKMESADWVKAEYDTVKNASFAVPRPAVNRRKGCCIVYR